MLQIPRILSLLAILSLFALSTAPVQSQSARFQHTVSRTQHQPPLLGREYWFGLMTNYSTAGSSGKYYALYVTSAFATMVHVQLTDGLSRTIQVQPFKSAVFNIPLAWEVSSAGRVETMGVHVWSNDADIDCHVMSHNPYTSDGFTVIPVIGWGKEYVVAAYAALFEGFGSYVYDLPSEFMVIAGHDNTQVTITPTQDLRSEAMNGANCSAIFANKGIPTTITLNKGQCIQCKTTCTQDCSDYDLTGTVITSNYPIGVLGGSQCPNIPCDFPYCDHVCEMIPPVRTWGQTYYTAPFFQPPSMPLSHSASTCLVIGSKKDQKIFRFEGSSQQSTLYCQLGKYETYWRNDILEGSRWSSDAPFLLVQYINSASYPDNYTGNGDPAEVAVPAVEVFQKTSVFQLPISIGNQTPYTNFVNVICKVADKHVILDGGSVKLGARIFIDSIYECYRLTGLKTGGHQLSSDSGAGVYVYGYGYDESYGWSGNMGNATINSPDTMAPLATVSDNCFNAHVSLVDSASAFLNTGIYFIRVDSQLNMAYTGDPKYAEGITMSAASYDMYALDHTRTGYLQVSVFDPAGNRTVVTSTYAPRTATLAPPVIDFGTGLAPNCDYAYDTIVNTGIVPDTIASLRLAKGNQGFTIDSASLSPLQPGEHRLIRICFKPTQKGNAFDTIIVGDQCDQSISVLLGNGGGPDFYVLGHDFGTVDIGTTTVPGSAMVRVATSAPITIDSMYVEDNVHFVPVPTNAPKNYWIDRRKDSLTIDPTHPLPVQFVFMSTVSDTDGSYATRWWAHSSDIQENGNSGWRSAMLTANIVHPTVIACCNTTAVRCVSVGTDSITLSFEISDVGNAASTIKSIDHSNSQTRLRASRQNGTDIVSLTNMTEVLQPGSKLLLFDAFMVPLERTTLYVDSIYVTVQNSDGSTALLGKPLVGQVSVVDCSADVRSASITRSKGTLITDGHWLILNNADDQSPFKLELLNLLGATVLRVAVQPNVPVDVSQLTAGVYLYKLTKGSESVTGKIVLP